MVDGEQLYNKRWKRIKSDEIFDEILGFHNYSPTFDEEE